MRMNNRYSGKNIRKTILIVRIKGLIRFGSSQNERFE